MPWKVTDPVNEREQLVRAHSTGRHTVVELAAHFDVTTKTAHKWVRRFREHGPEGLKDRPRAAHSHPNAVPEDVVSAVLRAKLAHPTWGPLKLQPLPEEPPGISLAWPAPSTRGLILAGLV